MKTFLQVLFIGLGCYSMPLSPQGGSVSKMVWVLSPTEAENVLFEVANSSKTLVVPWSVCKSGCTGEVLVIKDSSASNEVAYDLGGSYSAASCPVPSVQEVLGDPLVIGECVREIIFDGMIIPNEPLCEWIFQCAEQCRKISGRDLYVQWVNNPIWTDVVMNESKNHFLGPIGRTLVAEFRTGRRAERRSTDFDILGLGRF
jgi:hypothetical protein